VAPSPGPSRALRWLVRIFLWLPLVTVALLLGIALGWRIPAAIGALYVLMFIPLKIDLARRRSSTSRWLRHDKTLTAATAVVGGALGAAIFGGVGFILGAASGFVLGMSAFIPLSIKNEHGELVPYDESNAFQSAKLWKFFGLFFLIGPLLVAALFFWAWLTDH